MLRNPKKHNLGNKCNDILKCQDGKSRAEKPGALGGGGTLNYDRQCKRRIFYRFIKKISRTNGHFKLDSDTMIYNIMNKKLLNNKRTGAMSRGNNTDLIQFGTHPVQKFSHCSPANIGILLLHTRRRTKLKLHTQRMKYTQCTYIWPAA